MSKNKLPKLQRKNRPKEKIAEIPIDMNHLFKWIIIVLLVFGIVYLIMSLLMGEVNLKVTDKEDNINPDVIIDYKEILAGETFSKNHEEYYVIFFDFTSDDRANYDAYMINKAVPIYKVNTTNNMNIKYITNDVSNKEAKTISELKVKDPTLIKISNRNISKYVETKDLIIKELENIN